MSEERRTYARRAADRELLNQLQHLREQAAGEGSREQRHRRRRAIRHTCTVKISVQVGMRAGGTGAWGMTDHPVAGRLLDLSAEGCQLFTRDLLDIGTQMSLRITLETGEDIPAVAVVRWNRAVPERKGYAAGVAFTRVEDEARRRIDAFVAYLDRTAGL